MKLPYRNTIRNTKVHSMKVDTYIKEKYGFFLPGIRYQINDICFKKGDVKCGKYLIIWSKIKEKCFYRFKK